MVSPFLLLIYWNNLFILLSLFVNSAAIVVTWSKFRTSFKRLFLRVIFADSFYLELFLFEISSFIFAFLIVFIYFWVNMSRVHLSWNFLSGVFAKFLRVVFKPDIRISPPAGSCKVVVRVPVGSSYLLTSIDCFSWYNISFRFFLQAFFVYFWLVFIAFTVPELIDQETCP